MNTLQRKQVIDSIKGHNFRVTAVDVSSDTGIPLPKVSNQLECMASDAGHLEVSEAGKTIFQFDEERVKSYSLSKTIGERITVIAKLGVELVKDVISIAFAICCFTVFGIVILVCMMLIIPLLATGGKRQSNVWVDKLERLSRVEKLELKQLRQSAGDGTVAETGPNQTPDTQNERESGSLFNECAAYMFGDEIASSRSNQRDRELIAQLIRRNQGVVIEEELIPYISGEDVDEMILTVLTDFDGHPEVTDRGNIVYIFEKFLTASASTEEEAVPAYFKEESWNFTTSNQEATTGIALMSTLSLLGAYWIRVLLLFVYPLTELVMIANFILFASILYFIIPIVRFAAIRLINLRIKERNTRRKEFSMLLDQPSPELILKLEEAKRFREEYSTRDHDRIIYSTNRDMLEQQFSSK